MGEVKRYFGKEPQRPIAPQQIQVDLKNATPRVCDCGCKYFMTVIAVYTVSPFAPGNQTGQELTAQQPVLICKDCGEVLK